MLDVDTATHCMIMQGHLMLDREPHSRRFWRLIEELKEDSLVETESEGEETDSDSGEEGSVDSDSDYVFDNEEDWWQEQQIFGGW